MKLIVVSLAMVACILSVNGYSFKRNAQTLGDDEKALLRRMGVEMAKAVFDEDGAKEAAIILDMCLDEPLSYVQSCVKEEYKKVCERDDIDQVTCEGYEDLIDLALAAGEAVYNEGCHDSEGRTPSECGKELCMPYCDEECEDCDSSDCEWACDIFGSLLEENENEEDKKSIKYPELKRLRSIRKIRKLKMSSRRSRN